MRKRKSRVVLLILLQMFVAGCGGSDPSSSSSSALPASLGLTEGNATTVSGGTLVGLNSLFGGTSQEGSNLNEKQGNQSARLLDQSERLTLLQILDSQVKTFVYSSNKNGKAGQELNKSLKSVSCTTGSMEFTNDDADGNGRTSINDTLTLAYNQCQGRYGLTYNGSVSAKVTKFSLVPVSITVMLTMNSLTTNDGSGSVSLNGDITYSTSVDFSSVTGSGSISGDSLSVTVSGAENVFTAYSMEFSVSGGAYSWSGNGTVALAGIDGTVTFQTVTNFQGDSSSIHPTSGAMKITGASGGTLTVTVNGDTVTIDGDVNGDGKNDFTTSTTWSELTG